MQVSIEILVMSRLSRVERLESSACQIYAFVLFMNFSTVKIEGKILGNIDANRILLQNV